MTEPLSQFLFNKESINADFGIEIEIEGVHLERLYEICGTKWRLENDGSLRNGVEMVLKKPIKFDKMDSLLLKLERDMGEKGIRIAESDRTGIHLHLNVGDLTPLELVKFLCCYYIIEEAIIQTCGDNRIGNHFCLRAIDADYVISTVAESIRSGAMRNLRDEVIRYSALNLCSLFKFGSLEFRAIQTTPDFRNQIMSIANILYSLKETSKLYKVPEDILMEYSGNGVKNLVSRLITHEPSKQLLLKIPNLEEMTRRGMYLTQDICYAVEYTPEFTWGLVKRAKAQKEYEELVRRLETRTNTVTFDTIDLDIIRPMRNTDND